MTVHLPFVLPRLSPPKSDSRSFPIEEDCCICGCDCSGDIPNKFAPVVATGATGVVFAFSPKNKSLEAAAGATGCAELKAAKSANSFPPLVPPPTGLEGTVFPNADSKSPNSCPAPDAAASAARGLKSSKSASLAGLPTDGGAGHVLNRSSRTSLLDCFPLGASDVLIISSACVFLCVGELMPRSVDFPKFFAAPMSIFLAGFDAAAVVAAAFTAAAAAPGDLIFRLIFFSPAVFDDDEGERPLPECVERVEDG